MSIDRKELALFLIAIAFWVGVAVILNWSLYNDWRIFYDP